MRYLDPKNGLIFKRVFGERPNILKSFLNALLPLENGRTIESLTYLPAELVPELPMIVRNSLVDVRCTDNRGRQFIVEMQMLWTDSFKSRVLFNASKAYIRQLGVGKVYKSLQPVYALSIVNDLFEPDMSDWFHHYKIVHDKDQSKVIEGLELVFVELPKFKPQSYNDKRLSILWLRFLSEIKNGIEELSEELLVDLNSIPEIAQALELTKESAYTKAELETYDKYWDSVSTERTMIADADAAGEMRGIQIGVLQTAKKLKASGVLSNENIAKATGLSLAEVEGL